MRVKMLQELIGLKVAESEFVEDYLQIRFENGECLNVYNQYQIIDAGGRWCPNFPLRSLRPSASSAFPSVNLTQRAQRSAENAEIDLQKLGHYPGGHLTGATLSNVHDDGQFIRLTFSNAVELSIDMSEDGYLGPEAMQLNRPGLPMVVWRPDD